MHYVYTLEDATGKVVYCGNTINPKQRLYDHTRRKPTKRHGAFYGQDVTMKIVASKATRKEAWWAQVKWQRMLGLEDDWTKLRAGATFESQSKGGKTTVMRKRLQLR